PGRGRLLVGGALIVILTLVGGFVAWARSDGPGSGRRVEIELEQPVDPSALALRLAEAGLVTSPRLFAGYLRFLSPAVAPGRHLLRDDLGPRALAQRLTRSPARPTVRVTLPEGFQHRQIALRLAELEICSAAGFERAVFDAGLLQELRISGPSAEGRLFPATYELSVDSDPAAVVRQLARESDKRLLRLDAKYPGARRRLADELGFDDQAIVTLASIVERESADPAERPVIASVFFNRLRDPSFRPLRTLQSDPTAGYGCLVEPASAPSCADYRGTVTPAMLRDSKNRYNTYRHPGLPPGPIANPGEGALAAVLSPAASDYLYFVADGRGRHRFSRSFEEHRQAVDALSGSSAR
ncbi:MAG TPA: endolytic transglycosylase MltG, partial [Polyangiaceae bacterium]